MRRVQKSDKTGKYSRRRDKKNRRKGNEDTKRETELDTDIVSYSAT
jgi:hypothetical protein